MYIYIHIHRYSPHFQGDGARDDISRVQIVKKNKNYNNIYLEGVPHLHGEGKVVSALVVWIA